MLCIGISCSESLRDTYSDYTGDGKIRYLGKCYDLEVNSGWERLNISWKNSTDAVIDSIKVTWTANDITRDTLLQRTDTTVSLENLSDATYRIDVYAIGKDKSTSLIETTYGRPYTESHEIIRTFSQIISKFYKLSELNTLVFFMDNWNENIIECSLHYQDVGGNIQTMDLTKELFDEQYITLNDINTDEDIWISRRGKIEGCIDTIIFNDIFLGTERSFTSDFKLGIERKYGFTDQSAEDIIAFDNFIDTVRVLEFDYDMDTFEDILYCSKLEKLVLGKNRYLHPTYVTSEDKSILYTCWRN